MTNAQIAVLVLGVLIAVGSAMGMAGGEPNTGTTLVLGIALVIGAVAARRTSG